MVQLPQPKSFTEALGVFCADFDSKNLPYKAKDDYLMHSKAGVYAESMYRHDAPRAMVRDRGHNCHDSITGFDTTGLFVVR